MRTSARSTTPVGKQQLTRGIDKPAVDFWLLGSAIVLLMLGLVMITSASLDYANHRYGQSLFYFYRHASYLLMALVAAIVVFNVPINFFKKYAVWLLAASFSLLIIILLPGIGHTANNATRWLAVGPLTLQVSEVAKIGVVVYLASYLVRQSELVRSHILGFVNPMLVIMLLVVLLLLEPDFGAVVVLLGASLGMLFLGGVRIWQFALLITASLVAVAFMVLTEEYRMNRLVAYLDPWSYQQGGGYQLIQSLIAFGRGEWFGLGLGNSIQKLFFLPEAHTDFIFAVLAEELGLFGCVVTLGVYALLISRIFWIAHHAEQLGKPFDAYIAYGVGIIFSIQLFINVGVNIGLLPTKGLTLPFLSYGGSSLLVSCIFFAMVLRIDKEMKLDALDSSRKKGRVVKNNSNQRIKSQKSRRPKNAMGNTAYA